MDRPHAIEQIGHLLRSVVEELRNNVDGTGRLNDRQDEQDIEWEEQQLLADGILLPLDGIGMNALRVYASSSTGARQRRSGLRRNTSPTVRLSSRMARTTRASTSPSMMMAMMVSNMVHTKS